MRRMEFKMERSGLLEIGQKITVTEGLLPSNYYYIIDPSLAMSANIPFRNRLMSREGVVADIVEIFAGSSLCCFSREVRIALRLR